jgi:hypothetical protein
MAAAQHVYSLPLAPAGFGVGGSGEVGPCCVCYKTRDSTVCSFCDKGACPSCVHACDHCGHPFCAFCSIAKCGLGGALKSFSSCMACSYDLKTERHFCLACNAEEQRARSSHGGAYRATW